MTDDAHQTTAEPEASERPAEPVFRDLLFRQKRKRGEYREVAAPRLESYVADTHAHLQLLADPALSLARCAKHKVSFICTICDVYEDGSTTFDELDRWKLDAALQVRHLIPWC
ncbi:nitrate ABC transporter substrate-binding protein [Gordonibacter sp.]|uniref:nitrate ABC transporter substrate-binding protein n=1 Tax=Gordonibacter sp. TaxID=1968902 RepID=UPI002FCC8AF3